MKKTFAVVGGDARQQAAARWLQKMGCTVTDAEGVYRADYILLPMPLAADCVGLARLLRAAKSGTVAFGGRVSEKVQAAGQAAGVPIEDYYQREELAEWNAVPTAEGCLAIMIENRPRTLWKSRVLLTGYGRIARALALRLRALGAKVTVAARRAGARAQAEADGCSAVPMQRLGAAAAEADCIINTVPAPVLGRAVLQNTAPETLVIDLASKPGGTDFAAAEALGIRAIHALSLPARYAPETAGELVGSVVLRMIREREEGAR